MRLQTCKGSKGSGTGTRGAETLKEERGIELNSCSLCRRQKEVINFFRTAVSTVMVAGILGGEAFMAGRAQEHRHDSKDKGSEGVVRWREGRGRKKEGCA